MKIVFVICVASVLCPCIRSLILFLVSSESVLQLGFAYLTLSYVVFGYGSQYSLSLSASWITYVAIVFWAYAIFVVIRPDQSDRILRLLSLSDTPISAIHVSVETGCWIILLIKCINRCRTHSGGQILLFDDCFLEGYDLLLCSSSVFLFHSNYLIA